MKISLPFTAALLALAPLSAVALPNPGPIADSTPQLLPRGGDWQCNGDWYDGALIRLSFIFQGYCEDQWGQCFLAAIRNKGLIAHNWQAWKRDDGWWEVDVSTTEGLAWQVNNAIQDVTGLWRGCWPNK